MKITKMPGFGSFGAIVEDFDWNDINSYTELKQLSLEKLVVVVKGDGKEKFDAFANFMYEIATPRNSEFKWMLKYKNVNESTAYDKTDKHVVDESAYWALGDEYPGWSRVTGKKNETGKFLGAFPEGELFWHVDEPGTIVYYPLTILYGYDGMKGTGTAFLQTVDWFESQTESFKSELKEMVAIYDFNNLQSNIDPYNKELIIAHQQATGSDRMPLVVKSPGGHTGFRYAASLTSIEGMTKADSDKIVNMLRKVINDDQSQYRYDYWWEHDSGDLLLIDNTVTVHQRLFQPNADMKDVLSKRMIYRCLTDFSTDYDPYYIEKYSKIRQDQTDFLVDKNSFSILNWRQHFHKLKKLDKIQQIQYLKNRVDKADINPLIAALKKY